MVVLASRTKLPHLILPPDGQCCHSPAMLVADWRCVRPTPCQVNANCADKKSTQYLLAAEKSEDHLAILCCCNMTPRKEAHVCMYVCTVNYNTTPHSRRAGVQLTDNVPNLVLLQPPPAQWRGG